MAKHEIRIRQSEREVGKEDVILTVVIDGNKRGELHLSKGGLDWWPRNSKKQVHTKTWSELASFFES